MICSCILQLAYPNINLAKPKLHCYGKLKVTYRNSYLQWIIYSSRVKFETSILKSLDYQIKNDLRNAGKPNSANYTTKFTILPGTTITFFGNLPSNHLAVSS